MTPSTAGQKLRAYAVHLYTASGLVLAAFTMRAIWVGEYQRAFWGMMIAVLVDATDGTLARRWHVGRHAPHVDGRKLDDIVDYVNYTFVPLLMIAHAGWLPEPVWAWLAVPLIGSVFAFVHHDAKEELAGFFRGFPSYWNIVAFYVAIWLHIHGPVVVVSLLWGLGVLCVAPIRLVYPNRPPRWRAFFVGGGVLWAANLVALICQYPQVSSGWLYLSLVYPMGYVAASVWLDVEHRRRTGT